jgi:adenylate cyclase
LRALLKRLGLRGRLLLAFLGISAFSVIAAMAAMYSFGKVSTVLDQVSRQRMPTALTSLELSREAERIVFAAPALLAVVRSDQYDKVSDQIETEAKHLQELLGELKRGGLATDMLATIESRIDGLIQNVNALDTLVGRRLLLSERKRDGLLRLTRVNRNAQRLVAPGIAIMDAKVAKWRQRSDRFESDAIGHDASTRTLMGDITRFLPRQKAQMEIVAINDGLIRAAAARSASEVRLLSFPLHRSLQDLESRVEQLEQRLHARLRDRIEDFRALIDGSESILQMRTEELEVISEGEQLIAQNTVLSQQLTEAVDRLVTRAGRDVEVAN